MPVFAALKRFWSKALAVAAAAFLVSAVFSFLLWPIEKNSYSDCDGALLCSGTFSSKVGGGLYYVQHINETEQAVSESQIKLIYNEEEKAAYSFAPVPVLITSIVIGVGVSVITVIIYRVVQRRTAYTAHKTEEKSAN